MRCGWTRRRGKEQRGRAATRRLRDRCAYAFPVLRARCERWVGQQGRNLADFVLVGLAGPPG